ncbi:MAG: glutathione S-transferase family protein [Pseudomonadota bacterium]|nr:glutathione S-transferase family protein [Pseudomonadota bacterium]
MSQLTLVIGNKNYSSWSLRPWILLRHNGVAFSEVHIPLSRPDTADLLRPHSPTLKVPVLNDASLTVWDSLAICEYVSEQYLAGKGWPQAVAARAQARSFAAEMHSGFQALRSAWPMNVRLQRKLPVDAAVQRDIDRVCDIWESCLAKSGGPWLYGEFGIVDAMFAPVALRFHSYQPDLPARAQAYVQTHVNNPALREWIDAGRAETDVIREDEVGYLLGEPGWD